MYEGDEWLSTDSMVLMGIFTSNEYLKDNAEMLIRQRQKQHHEDAEEQMMFDFDDHEHEEERIEIVVDDILTELISRGSTSGWTTNYSITSVTLNELEEIR